MQGSPQSQQQDPAKLLQDYYSLAFQRGKIQNQLEGKDARERLREDFRLQGAQTGIIGELTLQTQYPLQDLHKEWLGAINQQVALIEKNIGTSSTLWLDLVLIKDEVKAPSDPSLMAGAVEQWRGLTEAIRAAGREAPPDLREAFVNLEAILETLILVWIIGFHLGYEHL